MKGKDVETEYGLDGLSRHDPEHKHRASCNKKPVNIQQTIKVYAVPFVHSNVQDNYHLGIPVGTQ